MDEEELEVLEQVEISDDEDDDFDYAAVDADEFGDDDEDEEDEEEDLAQALTALVDATLAVDEDAPCIDPACSLPGCDAAGEGA